MPNQLAKSAPSVVELFSYWKFYSRNILPESVKKSADAMLEKKPTKLLKQLISELAYLDEDEIELI